MVCVILFVSYMNTYMNTYMEPFNLNTQTFILLGDSILKNNAYVSNGNSVDALIKERTNGKTICLAVDHSKISDVFSQVEKIPDNLNTNNTIVFLSAGGNDILTHYVDQENDLTNTNVLGTFFVSYETLIKSIQDKMPNSRIVLLDIYYPNSTKYNYYHSIISEWNNMIYSYAKNSENNIYSVLKISNILTKPDDFAFGIEPSSIGSHKIVETILNNY